MILLFYVLSHVLLHELLPSTPSTAAGSHQILAVLALERRQLLPPILMLDWWWGNIQGMTCVKSVGDVSLVTIQWLGGSDKRDVWGIYISYSVIFPRNIPKKYSLFNWEPLGDTNGVSQPSNSVQKWGLPQKWPCPAGVDRIPHVWKMLSRWLPGFGKGWCL